MSAPTYDDDADEDDDDDDDDDEEEDEHEIEARRLAACGLKSERRESWNSTSSAIEYEVLLRLDEEDEDDDEDKDDEEEEVDDEVEVDDDCDRAAKSSLEPPRT